MGPGNPRCAGVGKAGPDLYEPPQTGANR